MGKVAALWRLFRVGQGVADPAKWEKRQITANGLVVVIFAIGDVLQAYGYRMPLSADDAYGLAVLCLVVGNIICRLATSQHVGILNAIGSAVAESAAAGAAARPDEAAAPKGDVSPQLHDERPAPRITPVDPFSGDHGA